MIDNVGTVKAVIKVKIVSAIPAGRRKKTEEEIANEQDEVTTANNQIIENNWKKQLHSKKEYDE